MFMFVFELVVSSLVSWVIYFSEQFYPGCICILTELPTATAFPLSLLEKLEDKIKPD